jgi:hypothetical protein
MRFTRAFTAALAKAKKKGMSPLDRDGDEYLGGNTCCGTCELSNLPVDDEELAVTIKAIIKYEGGNRRLVYYNRADSTQVKLLKKFGFLQVGKSWVNPGTKARLVQLYFQPTGQTVKPYNYNRNYW